jgi:beta-glucanase (GH16 family)
MITTTNERSSKALRPGFFMPLIWLLCACGGGGGSVGSKPAPSGQTTSQADNTAPVITLDGPATVEVVQGQSYNEAGATASDAVDGEVDVEISGEVDNQTIGTYTIRYSAVDQAGNEASVSRTVQVVAAHTSDSIELVVFANGMAGSTWDAGFGAYDQAIDYATCDNDNGSDCPSISWALASDADRGQVLEISRVDNDNDAGLFIKTNNPYDATGFAGGTLEFDIQIVSGDPRLSVKVDCVYPCTSGDFELGVIESNNWQTVQVDINELVAQDLDLSSVDTGLVIWPTAHSATVFRLDRVRWVANPDGATATAGAVSQPSETWINPNFEGPTSPTSYAGYSLYWSDEFTGDSLDSNHWNYELGTGNNGWGNNELQYYRQENTSVSEGLLVIEAKEQQFGGRQYTSSRLTTEDKMSFTYGRVDIRAALPKGQGIWPALWSLGANFSTVGWPQSGEIDIMEMIGGSGREDTVHGTAHWQDSSGTKQDNSGAYTLSDNKTLADGFHVYSLVWDQQSIAWYIDDVQYHSMALDDSSNLQAFHKPFFLIFNVAVGGNWPGSPNANTQFPKRMLVDYVRVFSKNE